MSVTRTLNLTFITETNQTHRLNMSDARPDLEDSQVNAAMNSIINCNVFSGQGGNLVGKKAAQIVVRDVQSFVMA